MKIGKENSFPIYSLRGKATEERERRGKMTLNLTISVRNGDHDLIDGY